MSLSSTQLPNAVGAAYSLKMDGKDACAVTFFGDGGSSEVEKKKKNIGLLLSLQGFMHHYDYNSQVDNQFKIMFFGREISMLP